MDERFICNGKTTKKSDVPGCLVCGNPANPECRIQDRNLVREAAKNNAMAGICQMQKQG
jgi:hypothetical protein